MRDKSPGTFKNGRRSVTRNHSSSLLGMLLISLGMNVYFLEHIIYDVEFPNIENSITFQDVILSGRPYHLLIIVLFASGAFLLIKELFCILRNN